LRPGSGDPWPDLAPLLGRLGRPFADEALLVHALSHRSWCAEGGGRPSNERLEFLGDAVLGVVVAEHCFHMYPHMPEGELAKVRAAVVNTAVLAEVGAELGLGDVLLLGRGEDSSGGRTKPSILANAVEAVLAAVYLDGGWPAVSAVVLGLLGRRIEDAAAGPGAEDFKTRLQEVVVRRVGRLPQYEVVGTGPDHERTYTATVTVRGLNMGQGQGRSKKDAEQAAAHAAWHALAQDPAACGTGPASEGAGPTEKTWGGPVSGDGDGVRSHA
jgi:ribonuclease III